MDEIGARFATASTVIREAGALALDYFKKLDQLTIKSKGLQDMASEADLNTELLIKRRLGEAFPTDAFLGEETGAADFTGASGIWVVDPIDGTQPFISGIRTWCISIAYVRDGEIEMGLVYDPCADELFAARRGEPATMNDRPIRPHPGADFTAGITSVGYSNRITPASVISVMTRLLNAGGMFHRSGSGTLSICYVACGRLLGYVEGHMNSWDALAAIAVVRGAGGRTNDFLADDGLTRGNPIIAAPAQLYDQVAALLD
ncbi:MAG TPA: inositol monophosphatase [Geminicoccus sp.]|uniref:inositol monophosphatase family protein n=1 Tax=Geminicoccus sp. TaxID=2024832 RepID=UPI002BD2E07D|nr:inositol monophosphatase [Geminicoccus sp.]HWL67417.1 inositol monophosphatase [Geminicoccus sp.]